MSVPSIQFNRRGSSAMDFVTSRVPLAAGWTAATDTEGNQTLAMPANADSLLVHGDVTDGPLTGFRITWAATPDGVHTALLEDDDFDTATALMPFATAGLWQSAAGSSFKIMLTSLAPVAELRFSARGAGAMLRLSGTLGLRYNG